MISFRKPVGSRILVEVILGVLTIATTDAAEKADLHPALAATGRSPEIPESGDVYGWLIGSWELDVRDTLADGSIRRTSGEAHFGWVLEGRAIQDVWIMPRRSERNAIAEKARNTYGTTLRVWDPSIQAWRIKWVNPVTGGRDELIGRWSGKDIVQVGTSADGTLIRWSFTEITEDSFNWLGESLNPDGKTWELKAEFRAKRLR